MNDERRRILDLLAQGKITVDEADALMGAIGEAPARGPGARASEADSTAPRYMRIVVHRAATESPGGSAGGYSWPGFSRPERNVNIRIPLSLVRSGMRLGAIIPGGAGDVITKILRQRGIALDLSKMDPNELANALKDLGELTVDVDQGKAQVRISCE